MKKQFLTVLLLGLALLSSACGSSANATVSTIPAKPVSPTTATPIKHIVVIFQENVSFDQWN